MLDVAIVGGGLCGLSLARGLGATGLSIALFEARERLGGRMLGVASGGAGHGLDLGAAWFWPAAQPLMDRAVAELGLARFSQFDSGETLRLADPELAPERLAGSSAHDGAYRLEGGMAALVDVLSAATSHAAPRLGHALVAAADCGDHVLLKFVVANRTIEVRTRHVALALPPRLVAQDIRFEPELDASTVEALHGAPTWMAARAKAVLGYGGAFWRRAGLSGNAFVTHEQAVLAEIFDACDASGEKAALAGFLALSPADRVRFRAGLPMLIASQAIQLFGTSADAPELHYQDWAREPRTCARLDEHSPAEERRNVGNPLLRRALWDGKLQFGGAETAARDAGLLEGALEAAQRIEQNLVHSAARSAISLTPRTEAPVDAKGLNAVSLARFSAWVAAQTECVFDDYRRRLRASLVAQERDQLAQRALLGAMETLFARALAELDEIRFNGVDVAVERGRSSLTPLVQQPFSDLMRSVVEDVRAFNQSSCALSNFPGEHRISNTYLQVILRDITAAWAEFSLDVNRKLIAKSGKLDHEMQPRGAPESLVS